MSVKNGFAMKKVESDLELCRYDGMTETTVYAGNVNNLKIVDLKWRKVYCEYFGAIEFLNLSEIQKQLYELPFITVVVNHPTAGQILQYGKYNDGCWWEVGRLCGYC